MKNYAKSATFLQPLSQERLKEVLHYEDLTGVFSWMRGGRGRYMRPGRPAGGVGKDGYVYIGIDGQQYFAHRLAWLWVHGHWPEFEVDHRNGRKDDNRIANLRDVTRSVNAQNLREARSDSASGVLGVSWNEAAQKWVASIVVDGRQRLVARSVDQGEAAAAYLAAKRAHHEGCTL